MPEIIEQVPVNPDLFPNLAKKLSKRRLQEIGQLVVEGYKRDKSSRCDWEDKLADWTKQFALQTDEKTFPWRNACFHEDVEILTETGWKYVKDVEVGELVFSREPVTGKIELKPVSHVHEYDAPKEGLIKLSNLYFDIQVTGNHRFLLENPDIGSTKEVTAKNILEGFEGQTSNRLPLTGKWDAEPAQELYGYKADDFLELLGWYVSEGWVYKNRCIGIAQSERANPEKVKKIMLLLERMGLSYKYNGSSFLVNVTSAIVDYFGQYRLSHNKRIPRECLDLPPEQLHRLFDSLVAGDGNISWAKDKHRNYPRISYFTTSKGLADDFQELCLKLGYSASITKKEPCEGGTIRGRKITGSRVGYTVGVRFINFSRFRHDRCEIKYVPYSGKVYCVTVPEWETIYVRQNGKPLWTMNSNIMAPITTVACIQFWARAREAILQPKNLIKGLPLGISESDAIAASRVDRYMNYQVKFKMENYEKGFSDGLMQLARDGIVVRKTYYDPVKDVNVGVTVSASDFVINYYAKDIESAERYTQLIPMSLNRIKQKQSAGNFLDVTLEGTAPLVQGEVKQQEDKNVGIEQPIDEEDGIKPRNVLEQHVMLSLNGKETPDMYICYVDLATEKVFRITTHNNPITGKKMEYFIKYGLIPNPGSFYDLGFGILLAGINASTSTLINQLIDAGTLANTRSGFVKKGSGMKRGDLEAVMGEFKQVDLNVPKLSDAIMHLDFKEPSNVLFLLLGMLKDYGGEITTVTETMTGEMPPSDTPATTIIKLIEQGLKVFSAIHKGIYDSFNKEVNNLYKLTGLHLNVEEYYKIVIDEDKVAEDGTDPGLIMQDLSTDFDKPLDLKPVADPGITSKAERAVRAQLIYETGMQNPLIANNPQSVYLITRDYYLATGEEEYKVDQIVQMPPPPPEPPDLPQIEENRMYFSEQMVDALPQQNHADHLQVIEDLENSPFYAEMPANGKNMLAMNKQQHLGFLYEQKAQDQGLIDNQNMQDAAELSRLEAEVGQLAQREGVEA